MKEYEDFRRHSPLIGRRLIDLVQTPGAEGYMRPFDIAVGIDNEKA